MRADDDLAVLPEEQRVSVGRGPCGEFAREIAVGARAILHDHRLPERLAEPGGDHAGKRIVLMAWLSCRVAIQRRQNPQPRHGTEATRSCRISPDSSDRTLSPKYNK